MIIGRFYYRLTASGNLIGEFSNQHSQRNVTESADRVQGDASSFLGDFTTTWQENGAPVLSTLNISRKVNTTNIFTLQWNIPGGTSYWGEAMMAENLLIGDYRDFDPIPVPRP